ncbi:WD40 repeat-like protein [Rhizoctonia solani]|uniref:WD40 repeat-like protein n=1 Tax=Rhizoctonia solani TaxID=456999 RepID=A0A8H7M3Q2_9AGAM|nr:WD40 repeat-like protein [Rhizoctonia solani]
MPRSLWNRSKSAHVDSANDENAPLPTGRPSARTSTPADTSGVKSGAWTGLRLTLKSLRDTPAMFGPLVSAANVLLDCFDTIEAVAGTSKTTSNWRPSLMSSANRFSRHATSRTRLSCRLRDWDRQYDQTRGERDRQQTRAWDWNTGADGERGRAGSDEAYRRIQSLFRQLQVGDTLSLMMVLGAYVWTDEHRDEHLGKHERTSARVEQKARLGELNAEKKATYDSQLSGPTNRRTCTEGTRVKVLDELKAWVIKAAGQSVYWMSGMAGTGKTTIACTFAKWLEAEKLLAASFFCTQTSADCQDVTRIIPTVAYQLARYSIPFRSALMKDDIPDGMVVVIDALDECKDQGGVGKLLDMLFKHAAQLPVRFFVTTSHEAIHLHKIEESLVSADIKLYLEEVLAPISPQASDIEELVRRSGVLFIYAATLFRYILPTSGKADSRKRLRLIMNMAPEMVKGHAQIDDLYKAVLQSALEDNEMEEEEKDDVRAVLHTVLLAQEPIGIQTIATLGAVGDTSRVEYALRSLSSVLYESARRSGTYFCDTSKHSPLMTRAMLRGCQEPERADRIEHLTPARICMPLLGKPPSASAGGRRNAGGTRRVSIDTTAVLDGGAERAGRSIYRSGYGAADECQAVADALPAPDARADGAEGQSDGPQRDSRTGHLEHSFGSIVGGVLRDGSRVAVGCLDGTVSIRNAYDGTLLVGPWKAHTDVVCGTCAPALLLAGPFRGHTNLSFGSFSPDSKRIVSGSGDNTVCIWDTADGTLLVGPLHGHTGSVLRAYSPNGTLIASASEDGTIRLWRSDGTPAVPTSRSHQLYLSVTFTPNGTRLVSGQTTRPFVCGGVGWVGCCHSISGSFRLRQLVAVSADGMLVASGSYDVLCKCGGSAMVGYSPDGTRVISGSYDGRCVWNVREGVMSPASSECSREGKRRMWDVLSGISQPAPPNIQVPHPPSHAASPDSPTLLKPIQMDG